MDAYRLALDQGRKELAQAQQSLKALSLRVSQLESIIAQLEVFTGGNEPVPAPSLFEAPESRLPPVQNLVQVEHPSVQQPSVQAPLWKAIINALNGKKSDFTVPEAVAALERTGRRMLSPNRLNIVRNTVIQNKAFGRLSTGHYYVRGFEIDVQERKTEEEIRN